jgi:hypothetical protein
VPISDAVREAKRRVSSALLDAPGIAGVGLRGGGIVVYLENDDPAVRERAASAVRKLAPGVAAEYEVSGRFGK